MQLATHRACESLTATVADSTLRVPGTRARRYADAALIWAASSHRKTTNSSLYDVTRWLPLRTCLTIQLILAILLNAILRAMDNESCGVCLLLATVVFGCSMQEVPMLSGSTGEAERVATTFVEALASRDYAGAYELTSMEYRDRTSLVAMKGAFEAIVPDDWQTVGPVEIGQTMQDWPGKKPLDVGWVYVSVGGDVYSEAVTVVVTSEGGDLRVRTVEFGRP